MCLRQAVLCGFYDSICTLTFSTGPPYASNIVMFIRARLRTIRKYAKNKNWPVARKHVRSLIYGLTHWKCLTCNRFKGASGSRYCAACRKNMQ